MRSPERPAAETMRCPRKRPVHPTSNKAPSRPPGSGRHPLLPVVWTASDPRRIAESLADALLHMLHSGDRLHILSRGTGPMKFPSRSPPHGPGPRLRRPKDPGRVIGRRRWTLGFLNTDDLSRTPSSIANPLGNGTTRIICPPFGIEARGGVLVACSPRADFPTEVDRLLLSVAANQVAILLVTLDHDAPEVALRESEEQVPRHVRERWGRHRRL